MATQSLEYSSDPPVPRGRAGWRALRALIEQRNLLAALEVLHAELGDVFRIRMPGFNPIVLVGPEALRFVLVTARDNLYWRSEGDPVTNLLRHGILVEDGAPHDVLRRQMAPAFHRQILARYIAAMVRATDRVMSSWTHSTHYDMLVEARRIALLILMEALFKVDFNTKMEQLWPAILRTLAYISPGWWLIWRGAPRFGYIRARQQLDAYLYQIIQARRATPGASDDLLGLLVTTPGLSDDLIRDQLLTMLIAGHDTSTALLAWALYLLGSHLAMMERARAEVDRVLGEDEPTDAHINQLRYLDQVIQETLRLYPPIHVGTRIAATDLEFQGYRIPAGTRVLYSIYLTHRHAQYWPAPQRFDPERFNPEQSRMRPAYVFLPFGGGPRNCIGAAFAQLEAKTVLARILQNFDLRLAHAKVHLHMGATLEPRPGVIMSVRRRRGW